MIKSQSVVWNLGVWKAVKIHAKRRPQAPKRTTIEGSVEWPKPRMSAARDDIIPHKM